jgi:hypothetical protein
MTSRRRSSKPSGRVERPECIRRSVTQNSSRRSRSVSLC